MERQPVKSIVIAEDAIVFALAVPHIADDGVTGVFEVPTDLVDTPRERRRFVEPVAAVMPQQPELGDRGFTLVPLFGRERVIY